MNSYNKQALDILAKEQGFIRDNLEKVMRLVEILNYFHNSNLLSKSLVLKGEKAKTKVKNFLSDLLVLTDKEKEYVVRFNNRSYHPELLFDDKVIIERIQKHPMALWKTGHH